MGVRGGRRVAGSTLLHSHAAEGATHAAACASLQNLLARADPLCNVLSGQLEAAQQFFGADGS